MPTHSSGLAEGFCRAVCPVDRLGYIAPPQRKMAYNKLLSAVAKSAFKEQTRMNRTISSGISSMVGCGLRRAIFSIAKRASPLKCALFSWEKRLWKHMMYDD